MKTRTNIGPLRGTLAAIATCAFVLLLAAPATAAPERTVRDPRFDTPYLSRHGRIDITKATASRDINKVTHSVTMRAKTKRLFAAAEHPLLLLNTKGGKRSPYEYYVDGEWIFKVTRHGNSSKPVATAATEAKRRTWRIRFDLDSVPDLGAGYGWAAVTLKKRRGYADVAPDGGYATSP